MADTKLIHPTLGWSIVYHGYRTADIYTPDGKCVDLVQVRPWDWMKDAHEQEPYEVTDTALLAALDEYLIDTDQWSLA
jgi:hypothetical protein